jgi:uncharacterized membrane protein
LPAEPSYRSPLRWLNNQPYLLLSLTSLFWAGNIVLGRYVAGHVPPMTLSCVRWIGVYLILWPFARTHFKRDWPALRAQLPLMVLLSATGFAINNALSYWALQYTQALNALLIQSSGPLFVALWSLLLFGVRLTWTQLGGIMISMVGVLTGCGAALLFPFSVWELSTGATLTYDLLTLATVIYAVIFPSTLAYLFFNRGIAADRAQPCRAVLPFDAGIRLGDGGPAARRAAAAVSPHGLRAGAGRRDHRLAPGLGEGVRRGLRRVAPNKTWSRPRGPWRGSRRPRCAACLIDCRARGHWRARRTPPCRWRSPPW